MVMSEEKIQNAVQLLRSFGAKRVLLFGSCVHTPEKSRDIDLAVDGIPFERLGAADVAVYRLLRMPFDLISRDEDPEFFELAAENAVTLYEQE